MLEVIDFVTIAVVYGAISGPLLFLEVPEPATIPRLVATGMFLRELIPRAEKFPSPENNPLFITAGG